MGDELVVVCQCWDLREAQVIRASLEARGVPVHVDGEHQRGALGMFGSAIELRIMVPSRHRRLAHELASEIIDGLPPPPPDEGEDGESAEREFLPQRRPLPEDALDHPDEDEGELDEGRDEGPIPRKKSVAIPVLLAVFSLSLGFAHIYAGRSRTGKFLLGFAALGIIGRVMGQTWGVLLIGAVWIIDLVGGLRAVVLHNRAVEAERQRERAAEEAEDEARAKAGDDDEDDEDDSDEDDEDDSDEDGGEDDDEDDDEG